MIKKTLSASSHTRDTLAMIMAGGRGSRLHQLTGCRAKPAVPFGGKYRIIDFTLSNCHNSGLRRIGMLTQYKSHSLIRHLQTGWRFLAGEFGDGVDLLPAEQSASATNWYAGTADAIYQNVEYIKAQRPRHVLVLAGDHIYKMDYSGMIAHHVDCGAQVTVGAIEVPLAAAKEFGVLEIDAATRVRSFVEKSPRPKPIPGRPEVALASMGIYVFDTEYLLAALAADAKMPGSSHDFGKDLLPAAIGSARVHAYPFTDPADAAKPGYWRDVGTVDAYWRANIELTDDEPALDLYDLDWPVLTAQEQLPPAKLGLDGAYGRGYALNSLLSGGCIVAGAEVRRSVLFHLARVAPGSSVERSLLLPGSVVGRHCTVRNAIIDNDCHLPDGIEIGVDRAADAARFHVSAGGVVLVTQAMLEAMARDKAEVDYSSLARRVTVPAVRGAERVA